MPPIILSTSLSLDRCPYCGIAKPYLVIKASTQGYGGVVSDYLPHVNVLSPIIPDHPREYLRQASELLAQPAGAILVCASAVDAMLKDKELKEGSLYDRIDQAATKHLITPDMAKWAHQVRLDANDQRHADEGAPLPTQTDAGAALALPWRLLRFST